MRQLMQKTIMLLLLLVPAAVLVGCSQRIDEAPEMKGTAALDKSSGPVQEIVIDNFTFSPATVTIAPGTRVVWINHDDVPHTATSTRKPRRFESATLATDAKLAHALADPGTHGYF